MAIKIRKAVKEDCPQMMQLIQELAVFEKEPDAVTVSDSHFEESGFGKHPVWWALVAENEADDKIIGMALYYIRYSTWKGQRLYLEDLIISEDWRGKGYGKQLFEQLLEIARAEGFAGMVWQVLDWNQDAIEFYQRYKATLDGSWINCSIDF